MENKKNELIEQSEKLKQIREFIGMNRKEFSEFTGIPLRNLEEWEAPRRKMPDYLLRMLNYYVRVNKFLEEKNMKDELEREIL